MSYGLILSQKYHCGRELIVHLFFPLYWLSQNRTGFFSPLNYEVSFTSSILCIFKHTNVIFTGINFKFEMLNRSRMFVKKMNEKMYYLAEFERQLGTCSIKLRKIVNDSAPSLKVL